MVSTATLIRGRAAHNPVVDLRGVSLRLRPGTLTTVSGPPGSGTSTLIRLVLGLTGPLSASVWVGDQEVTPGADGTLRHHIGVVYPALSLVPSLNVRENITLAAAISGFDVDEEYLLKVAHALAVDSLLSEMPQALTTEQSQQVAFARAFLTRPALVVADRPGRNLNPVAEQSLLTRVGGAARTLNQTVLIATSAAVSVGLGIADREVVLTNGAIASDQGQVVTGEPSLATHPGTGLDEDDLPESLDDIAPPPRLSRGQARLVSKAQRILKELPGPITPEQDNPFL